MNRRALRAGVAGLLAACLSTPGLCADPQRVADEAAVRSVIDAAGRMHRSLDATYDALLARIARLDIGRHLAPAGLASSDDLRAASADMIRFRALLAEHDRLLADAAAQAHALLESMPEGDLRERTLRNEAPLAERAREARAALFRSQLANADAMQALFDWADRNHASVHLRGQVLAVDGQQKLDELRALEARVDDTGREVQAAAGRLEASRQAAGQALATLLGNLGP